MVPTDSKYNLNIEREEKYGIDIGVRTFMTVYSNNKCLEIGTNLYKNIDKYLEKKDKLLSLKDTSKIKEKTYKKAIKKLEYRMQNRIEDLHKKVSNYLLKNYKTINIGKISIKSMVSNLKGNIKEKTKRRLLVLKHYKMRMY